MTTNVTDLSNNKIACDSRWSIPIKREDGSLIAVVYIDDTGFDKIYSYKDVVFVFAGNGKVIQEWKTWFHNINHGITNESPSKQGIAVCMIKGGKVVFEQGQDVSISELKIAGSGSCFAYCKWTTSRCSEEVVHAAIGSDIYSGGEVKVFDVRANSGNASFCNATSINDVNRLLKEKGIVMYIDPSNTRKVSVEEAVKSDELVEKLLNSIDSGDASVCAPFSGMNEPWPQHKIDEFDKLIADMIAE